MLKVSYEAYDDFGGRFGHLFYETPYSHYRLRIEYRFTGEQVPGGPGWAFRNSGVMIHGHHHFLKRQIKALSYGVHEA